MSKSRLDQIFGGGRWGRKDIFAQKPKYFQLNPERDLKFPDQDQTTGIVRTEHLLPPNVGWTSVLNVKFPRDKVDENRQISEAIDRIVDLYAERTGLKSSSVIRKAVIFFMEQTNAAA